jgi:predicted RNA-binding Zn-ribbon protein involved in translation (DUF1610 family)
MGTTVKASCPTCGEQTLRPDDVTLNVSNRAPETSHYLFTCPGCRDTVTKPADPYVIGLLTSSGEVAKTYWEPVSLLERRPAAALHPLVEDEVLDLMVALYAAPAALLERMPEAFR